MVPNNLVNSSSPVISICIPTFNRATYLENLFHNLLKLKRAHGDQIEICISNNYSTDNTTQVIENWRAILELKVITQPSNVGFTLNAIAVSRFATGKWLMIIGDDDLLIHENFARLLIRLQTIDSRDWILVGVADASGEECLLGNLREGRYDGISFQKILLRTGLYRFGFIGMHVFPATLQPVFVGLLPSQIQSWPHLALLLRHLQGGHIKIFSAPVIEQAGGGAALFWNIGDWVQISLRKLSIIAEARDTTNNMGWFFYQLLLRELYSLKNAKYLVLWKALDYNGFRCKALHAYISHYRFLGPSMFFAALHLIFLLAIYVTPSSALRRILRIIGKQNIIDAYNNERQSKAVFDGVQRGL